MKLSLVVKVTAIILIYFITPCFSQESEELRDKICIGETLTLFSQHLNKEMIIDIYLPKNYESSIEKYPVLFTCHCNFLHVGGICADLNSKNYTPGMIVAFIRNYDSEYFIPEKIAGYANPGRADAFIEFFQSELIPFIDDHFRTQPFRIFYSGSFGGGFCVYTFLTKPDVFNAYVAASPSINYEGGSNLIQENVESFVSKNNFENRFLYIGIDNDTLLIPVVDKFVTSLRKSNLKGVDWEYHHFLDEEHGSIGNKVIYHGLKYIFSNWSNIPSAITSQGVSSIKDYINNLNERYGYIVDISSFAIWKAAVSYEQNDEIINAIGLLNYYLEYHPEAHMFWRKLGKMYEKNNQLELAEKSFITAYEKAVASSSPYLAIFQEEINQVKQKLSDKKETEQ